jgi:glycosyltransferase involved in cell wall biosynthesis
MGANSKRYLVTIHVPIYVDGSRTFIATDWKRSLLLLRDSLMGRLGVLTVAAPSLPVAAAGSQLLEDVDGESIELVPAFDCNLRAREYWRTGRHSWLQQLRPLIAEATVVHAGLDDLYRPISYSGFLEGHRQGRPTVFVQDMDNTLRLRDMAASMPWMKARETELYASIYERVCRSAVKRAGLSLLKGDALLQRYGHRARNAKSFQDTSYLTAEIVEADMVARRLVQRKPQALRLVYCGQLLPRKGVSRSVEIIGHARASGTDVTLDIIGDGPERDALAAEIEKIALGGVRLLGRMPYGPSLLRRLADYDALLFTPLEEDTPRMIFDGYAAGLPLVGHDIEYVQERARHDGTVVLLPRHDAVGAASVLTQLARDEGRIRALTAAAQRAAVHHAADEWYRRRAEWTFEMVDAWDWSKTGRGAHVHIRGIEVMQPAERAAG